MQSVLEQMAACKERKLLITKQIPPVCLLILVCLNLKDGIRRMSTAEIVRKYLLNNLTCATYVQNIARVFSSARIYPKFEAVYELHLNLQE